MNRNVQPGNMTRADDCTRTPPPPPPTLYISKCYMLVVDVHSARVSCVFSGFVFLRLFSQGFYVVTADRPVIKVVHRLKGG